MRKDIVGATTEHWMDRRIRLHRAINDPSNLIRISAKDFDTMNEYKNKVRGTNKTLYDESEMNKLKVENTDF